MNPPSALSLRLKVRTQIFCLCNELKPAGKNIEIRVLPVFPSLSWLDEEPESALKGIREIVESVIKDMTHTGEEAPQPIACKRYSGKFMVRVPPEVHRNLAIQALESGVSLNRIAGAKLSR